jgi:hypothetical protein
MRSQLVVAGRRVRVVNGTVSMIWSPGCRLVLLKMPKTMKWAIPLVFHVSLLLIGTWRRRLHSRYGRGWGEHVFPYAYCAEAINKERNPCLLGDNFKCGQKNDGSQTKGPNEWLAKKFEEMHDMYEGMQGKSFFSIRQYRQGKYLWIVRKPLIISTAVGIMRREYGPYQWKSLIAAKVPTMR